MRVCLKSSLGATRPDFESMLEASRRRREAAFQRLLQEIPPGARAVCLFRAKQFPSDRVYWFTLTPGIPRYDPGAWRVSIFDEQGPWTHWAADDQGNAFQDLDSALRHVVGYYPEVIVSEVIHANGRRETLNPAGCP